MSRRNCTVLLALGCATAVVVGSSSAGALAAASSAASGQRLTGTQTGTQTMASSCPSSGGAKIADAPAPVGTVKVFGHGWGHGMGMSQYGAQGAARLGCGYRTILDTYYHDSSVVKRALNANVLLKLASAASASKLDAEGGLVSWAGGSRSAVQPKGSTWSVDRRTVSGRGGLALLDQNGARRLFVPNGGVLSAHHAGTVVKVRPTGGSSGLVTRWDTARFVGSSSGIAVTEVIGSGQGYTGVQKYLMGLAEVPVSWPVEALKAQVVAARTYLSSKYSSSAGAYAVTTTTSDQVYRGYQTEKTDAALGGRWHKAVLATLGQVIVDSGGRVIEAMYSSSSGGYTENRQYVYGNYGISYLKAVDDSRWDNASDNPYRRWSKGFSKASFAKRFGFDSVSSWTVAKRGSAKRLAGMIITGIRGGRAVTKSFTGTDARNKLDLRSPGFVFAAAPIAKPIPAPARPAPPVTKFDALKKPTPKTPLHR
jgi:SpoIID/LytB domain protein